MNIKELIAKLQTLPGDMRILVQGYEDGYDDIVSITNIKVIKNSDPADYNGEYNIAKKALKTQSQQLL